jgi:hypothetical protein
MNELRPILFESTESYEASQALYEASARQQRRESRRISSGDVAFVAFIALIFVAAAWSLYAAAERDQSPDGWNPPAQMAVR